MAGWYSPAKRRGKSRCPCLRQCMSLHFMIDTLLWRNDWFTAASSAARCTVQPSVNEKCSGLLKIVTATIPVIFLCVCAVFGPLHLIHVVLWNQSVEFDWFHLQTQTQTTEEKGGTAATQKCSILEYYIFTSDENKRRRHRLHVCDTYHHFDECSLLVYVQSIHQDF